MKTDAGIKKTGRFLVELSASIGIGIASEN
jgi:hypothetical protein